VASHDDTLDQLAVRARSGDSDAFRQVVLRTESDLRAYVASLAPVPAVIDEVVQAAFVSAYQNLRQYRGDGAFIGWLKTIARNHALRALREQKRFAELNGDALEQALVVSALETFEDVQDDAAQRRRLQDCLQALPARSRTLIEARYAQGISAVQLARDLSRTEVWVRVTLCRVRQALRRCLEAAV
jgi:RNA polymerase sigma-70 factor, ECF subfamily